MAEFRLDDPTPAAPGAGWLVTDGMASISAAALLDAAGPRFAAAAGSAMFGAAAAAPATDDYSDLAVRGDVARAQSGMTGAGVRVGILSDSFDLGHGYAADVLRGDLPAGVQVLQEGPLGSHDEGRAMADLIHRIAPGAQLLFHTATAGQADFAAGIRALQAAGCQVIVDDVSYYNEPFFQDGGTVQAAVEQAVASGVDYFTSASNEGTDFYEASFAPLRSALPGLPGIRTVQDFGYPGAPSAFLDISVASHGACTLDLQWDQPFASIGASIGGGGGSSNSLALVLYDQAGQVVAASGRLDAHRDPVQVLAFINPGEAATFRLAVVDNGTAAPPGLFKVIAFGAATIADPRAGSGSGTATGHELVAGANVVGAIAWSATPRFGGSDRIEPFSSVGPGRLLFDAQGHRLATPIAAAKVDFVAPDGSLTSVFAPFYGTSAAAPDAAAVAALVLQQAPGLTPAQVTACLRGSAIPVQGSAAGVGAGLIQADRALALAALFAHH